MPTALTILQKTFAADSMTSVILRGAFWLILSIIILISTDKPDPEESIKDLKTNLGFFLMISILSGGLIYLLFGFTFTS